MMDKLLGILKNKISGCILDSPQKNQFLLQSILKLQERLLLAFVGFNASFCTSAAFGAKL